MKTYDLIVIGAGPAGYQAALEGAKNGFSVALIERKEVGGTCLNSGCIPTKTLLETAKVYKKMTEHERYAVQCNGEIKIDREGLIKRKEDVIFKLREGLRMLLLGAGIEIIRGEAKLQEGKRVLISGRNGDEGKDVIIADKIIIASGSSELVPDVVGKEYMKGSTEVLELDSIPKSVCIVGGGVIGMEFAHFYSSIGCEVKVIEALPDILCNVDRQLLQTFKNITSGAYDVNVECIVKAVRKKGDCFEVVYEDGESEKTLTTDMVIAAVGRRACTENLGLNDVGILHDDKGFILVDENFETNVKGIYAAGDVIGGIMLAHKAFDEGIKASYSALSDNRCEHVKKTIPQCIYTEPEIAYAGIGEEIETNKKVKGYCNLASNGRSLASGADSGMVKVIADAENGQILGIHMIGENVTEIIGSAVYAIDGEFTVDEVAEFIMPHPTVSEAVREAARDCKSKMERS